MKSIIIFAAAIALTLPLLASATEPTYFSFEKMVADSEQLARALEQGGVSDDGEPCTFKSSLQDWTGRRFLVLDVESKKIGAARWALDSTINDELLRWADAASNDGTLIREFKAFDHKWAAFHIGTDGSPRMIRLYASSGDFICGLR